MGAMEGYTFRPMGLTMGVGRENWNFNPKKKKLHASLSALWDEEAWRYSQDWNKAGLWLVSYIVILGFDRSMPQSHFQDIVILSIDVGTQLWNKTSTLHIDLSQEKVWERVYRPSIYSL